MEVVVDTSVLVAVALDEPEKQGLVARTRGTSLMAPSSVHWEIGNAVVAAVRRNRLTLPEARAALSAYGQIPIRYVEVGLDEALKLAGQHGIYAYDAYVLVCAARYRRPLLSLDRQMTAIANRIGINLMEI